MQYTSTLTKASLIKRYKRFLADVTFCDGKQTTVHCPNPGAMIGLSDPGTPIWLSKSNVKTRKHPYTWELSEIKRGFVGINTNAPNKIIAEALKNKSIDALAAYRNIRAEVKYGQASRIDFLLTEPGEPDCYVEVKNVHLFRQGNLAEFPDCVTKRGTKHLGELKAMCTEGHRSVMLYLIQAETCDAFSVAGDIDPVYADALHDAQAHGVEVLAYTCRINQHEIDLDKQIPYCP